MWKPKKERWWNRDWMNNEGDVAMPAGTVVPNQPGNPDTQMRLSSRGLLPWLIGDDCLSRPTANGLHGCKGCRERDGAPPFEPPSENGNHIERLTEANSPGVVLVSTQKLGEPELRHTHRYRGKRLGSPCATDGCAATRQTEFKSRKKAAVTMAEAAA